MHGRATQRGRARITVLAGLAALVMSLGCTGSRAVQTGRATRGQADDYLRDAVRMSSEGVLLEPRGSGIGSIDRVRLGEIAQELRLPAAICFVERAIQTMQTGEVDGEAGWVEVPEGQIKIRTRIAIDGKVMSTEVLDSGFVDEHMEGCLREVLESQRFPESRDSFAYSIDVYYWVSLGVFSLANTEGFDERLRREQAEAARRAKPCLQGRLPAGEYRVSGVNLFDRDGDTIVNRVDPGQLAPDLSACVAQAFRGVRIYSEPEAFVRPAEIVVEFAVDDDGQVSGKDDRWLEIIELEELAERERRRAELAVEEDRLENAPDGSARGVAGSGTGSDAGDSDGEDVAIPRGGSPDGPMDLGPTQELSGPGEAGSIVDPDPVTPAPGKKSSPEDTGAGTATPEDPAAGSQGGIKIDLSPRRSG
ncbi:hypothetical protein [Plesiocystis pacifica]|nr:hypothetical protein [Plesiocystis pacifica]